MKAHVFSALFVMSVLFSSQYVSAANNVTVSDWDAQTYDQICQPQFEASLNVLKEFNIDFKENEQFLDIGCRTGRLLEYLSGKMPSGKLVGIDSSKNMIDFAKKRCAQKANVELSVGDVVTIPFDKQFDAAFSCALMHWLSYDDQIKMIQSVFDSLKPKGVFIGAGIVLPMEDFLIVDILDLVLQEEKWQPYAKGRRLAVYLPSRKQVIETCANAGFSVLNTIEKNKDLVFGNKQGLLQWITTLFSHTDPINRMPKEIQNSYFSRVVDQFLSTQKNLNYSYTIKIFNFLAQKL